MKKKKKSFYIIIFFTKVVMTVLRSSELTNSSSGLLFDFGQFFLFSCNQLGPSHYFLRANCSSDNLEHQSKLAGLRVNMVQH